MVGIFLTVPSILGSKYPVASWVRFGGMARRNGCCSDEGNTRNILVSQMCNSGGDIPAVSPIHISPSM